MGDSHGKGHFAASVRKFVSLCAGLIVAVPAAVLAAPTESVLYNFCSLPNCGDGYYPLNGGMIADTDGNFYGTTYQGGASGVGTVF